MTATDALADLLSDADRTDCFTTADMRLPLAAIDPRFDLDADSK
jgi:hypothetical protein